MKPKCIFCPTGGKKSKEHIWPEWMGAYFGRGDGQSHHRDTHTARWNEHLSTKKMKRPGHLSTLKVRAVCESCNNGWMNRLEAEVKKVLEPMLEEKELQLDESGQQTLALWITVKTMVGEYAEPDIAVTPENDRHRLKNERFIPDYYAIYLGHHASGTDNAWLRMSMTIALSKEGPSPPLNGFNRNAQSIAFLCGPVFLYVLVLRVDGIETVDFIQFPKLARIFPPQHTAVGWPMDKSLSTRDMGKIAYALENLKHQPNVHYGGDLP